jgi:hypothetical protein
LEEWERPGKKLEPWPKTGSAGDASWKPYALKGVKGNKSDLNNIRCEISRHFKNKKREYLKDKINELALNSKNKNIRDLYRGINEFKRSYHNLVKDENGDLLADSHNNNNNHPHRRRLGGGGCCGCYCC